VVSILVLVDSLLGMMRVIGYLGVFGLPLSVDVVDWNDLSGCKGLFGLLGIIGLFDLICVVSVTSMMVWLVSLCLKRLDPQLRREVALRSVQK
jgi:hypothetical protein